MPHTDEEAQKVPKMEVYVGKNGHTLKKSVPSTKHRQRKIRKLSQGDAKNITSPQESWDLLLVHK